MLTCLSKQYFGVECPGCGAQRAFVCLIRGEFLESFALYPALIPFFIFVIVSVLSLIKPISLSTKWVLAAAIVAFSLMIGQYVLKMMGLAPWYDAASSHFHL
jgi:hypothetical protein